MLFKVDENLPVEIAELLSDLGHDAKTIKDGSSPNRVGKNKPKNIK